MRPTAILLLATGPLLVFAGCHAASALPPPHAEVARQLARTLDAARRLGPDNPLLVSALHSSAAFYHERRRYEQAEAAYRELLRITETRKGAHHQDVALILERYADVLRDANRPEDAQRLRTRARLIRANQPPPGPSRR